jgi:hypothetical protein
MCIVYSILAYLIIMFISTNLIGLIVRGLILPTGNIEESSIAQREINKYNRSSNISTLIFILIALLFIFILYSYWNIFMALAAIIIMSGRIPDLINELKSGKKFKSNNSKFQSRDYIATVLGWQPFPILLYSFNCIGNDVLIITCLSIFVIVLLIFMIRKKPKR